jgi:hypothetical protein
MMSSSRVGGAQEVGGTVRDAATSEPVRGAVVVLLGPNRELLARTITSSTGSFRLTQAGATTLRVIRIGYSPYEGPVTAGSALAITLTPLGTSLRAVAVTTRPVCPARQDQREALALWSSATDALLAMVVGSTESADSGTVVQLLYDRMLGTDGRRLVRQSTRRVVTGNTAPIRADRSPEDFVEDGYVVRRGDVTTYHGPDPEVLLDSSFAETHCLSIRRDERGHPGEVGVVFGPTRDRDSIPDIAGVLWLARAPLSLRSMTFAYRGVDPAIMEIEAGGRLDFETLSNGLPIIRSWHIRSPKVAFRRSFRTVAGRTVFGQMAVVHEVHETGGLIADGRLGDGTHFTAPLATLGGRVLNERTDDPARAARVTVDSTDLVSLTDGRGQFSFEGVLPGPYTLRVRDSITIHPVRVDSAQNIVPDTSAVMQVVTRVATVEVEARLGVVAPVDVRLPWRAPVGGCGPLEQTPQRYVVAGTVVTRHRLPVPNARVRLSWADTTRRTTVETQVEGLTGPGGGFIMCGIPGDMKLGTRVITASGAVHHGSSTVSRLGPDGQSRLRSANLRAVRIVLSPDSSGKP